MLATATVIAQEYHGEMERLYPDKTKTTKKTLTTIFTSS